MPPLGICLYFVDAFICKNAESTRFPLKESQLNFYNANTWTRGVDFVDKRRVAWVVWVVVTMLLLSACDAPSYSAASTISRETEACVQAAAFPLAIPDSPLIAEKLVDYSGPYWEDGSGEAVEHVAGLMLANPTDRLVEFAAIAIEQDAKTLYFFVYHLPPNSRCLVLEHSKNSYLGHEIRACRELCVRWGRQELSREQVDYVGLGPSMTIINRDERALAHVTVRYKRYVQGEDYYLGGAVFSEHLFFVQPQERRSILPRHYEAGRARIVGICVET